MTLLLSICIGRKVSVKGFSNQEEHDMFVTNLLLSSRIFSGKCSDITLLWIRKGRLESTALGLALSDHVKESEHIWCAINLSMDGGLIVGSHSLRFCLVPLPLSLLRFFDGFWWGCYVPSSQISPIIFCSSCMPLKFHASQVIHRSLPHLE